MERKKYTIDLSDPNDRKQLQERISNNMCLPYEGEKAPNEASILDFISSLKLEFSCKEDLDKYKLSVVVPVIQPETAKQVIDNPRFIKPNEEIGETEADFYSDSKPEGLSDEELESLFDGD